MKSGLLSSQICSRSWDSRLKPSQFHTKQEKDSDETCGDFKSEGGSKEVLDVAAERFSEMSDVTSLN